MVLAGATTIKRERVPNEVISVDDGAGVGTTAAAGVGAAVGAGAGQHEGATSCRRCCGFLCDKFMNTLGNHFVTLEILLHERLINVYDCNLVVTEHDKFFTLIQPLFELLPKLLKQSGIMNHFPEKFLTQPWEFNSRIEHMVQNASGSACGSYSITFIEHLISRTKLHPLSSLLCDNLIERMQFISVNGIISQSLKP
ncbi:hypothetical protein EJD97_015410 [Solanum chilense]|uniref:Ubiquitin-like protease family profile domain-containing protein n=1 Tax=Solanum chilense TaxID=4083 RepID=A0A6N2B709_SOLCI|nr:hypothetical protein EJD97_015410 [Solanum chilense]